MNETFRHLYTENPYFAAMVDALARLVERNNRILGGPAPAPPSPEPRE